MPMAALVYIENETGSLTRYEVGGDRPRATHACTYGSYVDLLPITVELFRTKPPEKFLIGDAEMKVA